MKRKSIKIISLLFALIIIISSSIVSTGAISYPNKVKTQSDSILLVNMDTNQVVFEKDADSKRYPASTTKIMTYIIVAENIDDFENTRVPIKKSVLEVLENTGSSLANVADHVGKDMSVIDLLYSMMVPSGNDAAMVLADYVGGGNIDSFVKLMNDKAKELGCNKIALGHHMSDVIETTLMNMLNSGSFQTMLPKLHSTHFAGMEIIRPLYLVREEDILAFRDFNHLRFIQCACRFTENVASAANAVTSQRAATKALIKKLKEEYSPVVEKNIFKAACNVTLDKVLGYKENGIFHSYLDNYEEEGKRIDQEIKDSKLEEKVIEKAEREHRPMQIDDSFSKKD